MKECSSIELFILLAIDQMAVIESDKVEKAKKGFWFHLFS